MPQSQGRGQRIEGRFRTGLPCVFSERADEIVILLCGGTKKGQDGDVALAIQLAKEL